MEDSQIRECIYKHILTESAFTEDLKIEFYNTRRLHQSLDYGTYNNYTKEVA
jgi:transposase InsO family protein